MSAANKRCEIVSVDHHEPSICPLYENDAARSRSAQCDTRYKIDLDVSRLFRWIKWRSRPDDALDTIIIFNGFDIAPEPRKWGNLIVVDTSRSIRAIERSEL